MKTFMLSHRRNDEDLDGFKIIGIYSTEELAKAAIESLRSAPGFRDHPDNFHIHGYETDKTFWIGGFS